MSEFAQDQKRHLEEAQYNTGVALVQVALAEDSHARVAITRRHCCWLRRTAGLDASTIFAARRNALAFLLRSDACAKK
jgi:hypothetical protein